jgi:hypothetical protein
MKRPQGSINAASGDSAASKAAYRFFASEIAADAILEHLPKIITGWEKSLYFVAGCGVSKGIARR